MGKILIVDDSETLRLQLRVILEKASYEVVAAVDGVDGLKKAQEHDDLRAIIIDFNMPHMDGLTMAAKVREIPKLSSVPLIMLTAEATTDIKKAGRDAGIGGWMVKPIVADKLIPALKMVLTRSESKDVPA